MTALKRVVSPAGKTLQKAINQLKDNKVGKVGWFVGSRYPEGTQVATVAAIQEFGAPEKNIPPRAFMRPTIIRQQQAWVTIAENGAKAVIEGRSTTENVMEQIGLKAAGDIREAISKVLSPPLKPATIAARLRRKSDKKTIGLLTKPLIDTGILIGTLTNTVETE